MKINSKSQLGLHFTQEARKFIYDNQMKTINAHPIVGERKAYEDEIIDIISNYVPDLSIQYVDTAIMNQLSYHVSNDRFKNLGFEFHGNLAKGISETIQLFKGILS